MGHPIHNSFKSNHDKNELINVDMPIYNIVKDRHLEKIKYILLSNIQKY